MHRKIDISDERHRVLKRMEEAGEFLLEKEGVRAVCPHKNPIPAGDGTQRSLEDVSGSS